MTAAHDHAASLDLTRQEAWVIHAALLDHIERSLAEGDEAPQSVSLLERMEADGDAFTPAQLRLLREALAEYLVDPPARDRPTAERLLVAIEDAMESPSVGQSSSSQ